MKPELEITHETLMRYRDGKLASGERDALEERISREPALRAKLDSVIKMDESLAEWGRYHRVRDKVKASLRAADQQTEQESGFAWNLTPRFAAGLACALVAIFASIAGFHRFNDSFSVVEIQGGATISQTGVLNPQHTIHTNEDSFAKVKMGDGMSSAEFGPDTIAMTTGKRSLRIERGAVWNEVASGPDSAYQVATPQGVVTVLGTRFEVRVEEGRTTVSVEQGAVRVQNDAGSTILAAGKQAILMDQTTPSASDVPDQIAVWRRDFTSKRLDTRSVYDGMRAGR